MTFYSVFPVTSICPASENVFSEPALNLKIVSYLDKIRDIITLSGVCTWTHQNLSLEKLGYTSFTGCFESLQIAYPWKDKQKMIETLKSLKQEANPKTYQLLLEYAKFDHLISDNFNLDPLPEGILAEINEAVNRIERIDEKVFPANYIRYDGESYTKEYTFILINDRIWVETTLQSGDERDEDVSIFSSTKQFLESFTEFALRRIGSIYSKSDGKFVPQEENSVDLAKDVTHFILAIEKNS